MKRSLSCSPSIAIDGCNASLSLSRCNRTTGCFSASIISGLIPLFFARVMNCALGAPPPDTKIAPVAGFIAIPAQTLATSMLSATLPVCASITLTLWSCQPAVLAKTVLPSGLTMIFITISPGNAICRPAGVILQQLGSNTPLPSCVGPGLITPAQSASFRQLPASAMADASKITAEVATNNRRFICHPQKKVGQTGSLPGLPERPHRRGQGKLPGSAGILACRVYGNDRLTEASRQGCL